MLSHRLNNHSANPMNRVRVPIGIAYKESIDQVRQILINLFSNAAQAAKGRGRIHVEGASSPGGGARLRVRDEGPGIPEEARHRIFEALYTTKAKGSGLGLALCRRIMEAHGGTIELARAERGASFVLAFAPAAAPA